MVPVVPLGDNRDVAVGPAPPCARIGGPVDGQVLTGGSVRPDEAGQEAPARDSAEYGSPPWIHLPIRHQVVEPGRCGRHFSRFPPPGGAFSSGLGGLSGGAGFGGLGASCLPMIVRPVLPASARGA